ncbi:GNAT family N-acetyltransferase [Rothia sp. p3-SID1597]|nr:GNAT family N-acetyltransferase [Rothia sp. p3-SID1597]
MQRVYSLPDVYRFLPYGPFSKEEAMRKNNQRMTRTSLDTEHGGLSLMFEYQGTAIGMVSLWTTDDQYRNAEIGWAIDPNYGGQGLASEAVTAVLDVAFGRYALHRVVARVDPRNTSSVNLALRVGMIYEGCLRKDFWHRGEWTDTLIYSILDSDIQSSNYSVDS